MMKIKSHLLKLISAMALTLSLSSITQANDDMEVTPEQQMTKQEFAALYVISEICPNMVSNPSNFQNGLSQLLQQYLPDEKNPVEALKQMVTQADFSAILQEAENDAKTAGKEKNLEICEELAVYKK